MRTELVVSTVQFPRRSSSPPEAASGGGVPRALPFAAADAASSTSLETLGHVLRQSRGGPDTVRSRWAPPGCGEWWSELYPDLRSVSARSSHVRCFLGG